MTNKAFSVLETDENTGGIVFAKSAVEARRIGANLYNHDDFSGLSVHRVPRLDKFEQTGVPAWLLVADGWRFECFGCGMSVNEDDLADLGMKVEDVVGRESGRIFCCHTCRRDSMARDAAIDGFGRAFLDMMQDIVRRRFPVDGISFGEHRHHVYVPKWYSPLVVVQAHVGFSFPGMKIGPASLHYRHEGPGGTSLIGPAPLEFHCCNGDRETFEAFAAETKQEAR